MNYGSERNERTKGGLAYEALFANVREKTGMFSSIYSEAAAKGVSIESIVKSKSAEDREIFSELKQINDQIMRMKQGITPQNVHHDALMQNLSVAFADDDFIGDRIMPDLSTNGQYSGVYWEYSRENRTEYPDDTVANGRVQPNEISELRIKRNYLLQPRSFISSLEADVINNQSAPLDEMVDLGNSCLYGLKFKKEMRIASVVLNAANYATNNKITLSGTSQFTDPASTPIQVFDDGKNALVRGQGAVKLVAYMGIRVLRALRAHPQLLSTLLSTSSTIASNGLVSKETVAAMLGVDEILIGTMRKNTGTQSAANYSTRIWDETKVWIGYVAKSPSLRSASFGYSFVKGPTESDLFWKPEEGAFGIFQARASCADEQRIVSADSGYLITGAVA